VAHAYLYTDLPPRWPLFADTVDMAVSMQDVAGVR